MSLFRRLFRFLTAPFRAWRWAALQLYRARQTVVRFLTEEPEERPLGDALEEVVQSPAALLPHIAALRRHILRAFLGFLVATVAAFIYTPRFLDFLARPIGGMSHLQAIEVTEPIGVFMRVALLLGFAVSLPYTYLELFLFIAPGLRPRARRIGLLGFPLVLLFFVGGMAFAYYAMLPTALPFLLNFMGIHTVPRPDSYIRFVTALLFWTGLSFEFPLVIYLLAAFGVVRASMLWKHWREAVVAIAVVAAVITPTVDPINMLLVMAPLTVLYFLGAVLAKFAERSRPPVQTTTRPDD
ncbi:MAG TPA: twin-arginine translocase subunit TatC [Chloroflexi bacterium]|nr:twin-arginine translocase subunit TatC [Chloroflexota bacterium]